MGACIIGSMEIAPSRLQGLMKHLGDLRLGFFSQIVPETHVLGIFDHILNDPFPEVVRKEHPIHLCISVPLKKRLCMWLSNKDEIALFGCQHHLIPIDHKHLTRSIPYQISCMQVCVTDDIWACSSLEHLRQLF